MSAQLKFPRQRLKRALLATLTSIVVLAIAVPAANARLILTPSTQGAGTITPVAGSFFGFNSCDNTGNQNDDAVAGCPGTDIAGFLFDLPVQLQPTPAATPAGHWIFVGWQNCPSVSGSVCLVNNPFFANLATASPRAVFRDVVAPTITAISVNKSSSTDRGVSFGIGANETLSNATCSVDGGAEAACGTVRQFNEGNHSVRARGTDLSSNTAGALSAVTTNFRIVDTTLTSTAPADFSSVKRPTFTYSSVAGVAFECRLFNTGAAPPAFTPCGSKVAPVTPATFTPAADLTDGSKTFQVRAVDGPDIDLVPFTRVWTVDTVAPDTTLLSPDLPEGVLTTLLNANFTFASTEPVGAIFQCRLEPAAFAPCTSPKNFTDLAFGKQKFEVRAVDRAGNVDGTPATRNWEIAAADNDGDGFNQRSDCNDNDAAINPGRAEINDNDVDENCDGVKGVTPPPVDNGGGGGGGGVAGAGAERILIAMPFAFSKSTKKFTVFTVLQVKAIPIGSTLKVTCAGPKGKKCPGGKSFTKTNAFGTVNLKQWLKKKLLAGTKITAVVTKPGNFIGASKTMTVQKKKRPSFSDKCIAPGTTKAVGC